MLPESHERLDDLQAALRCLREAATIDQALRAAEIARQSRAIAAHRRVEEVRLEAERYRPVTHCLL